MYYIIELLRVYFPKRKFYIYIIYIIIMRVLTICSYVVIHCFLFGMQWPVCFLFGILMILQQKKERQIWTPSRPPFPPLAPLNIWDVMPPYLKTLFEQKTDSYIIDNFDHLRLEDLFKRQFKKYIYNNYSASSHRCS